MQRDSIKIAQAIVCRLGKNVAPPSTLDDGEKEIEFVGRVLAEEGCTPAVFQMLDEKPGKSIWGGYEGLQGEWHYRLRRFRNRAGRERFTAAIKSS